jgi:hypothetical protein
MPRWSQAASEGSSESYHQVVHVIAKVDGVPRRTSAVTASKPMVSHVSDPMVWHANKFEVRG